MDRRCYPHWEIVKQRIGFHDLTFVVEGKSVYSINGTPHPVEAGDIIYIPPGNEREAHTSARCPMHSYAFNFNWWPQGSADALPLPFVTKGAITSELLGGIKQFSQVWMSKQAGYIMQSRALFMLLLHRLVTMTREDHRRVDKRVNQMLRYVNEHYAEELDLSQMSQMVGLHPVYLGKLFKTHTGCSFREYVNRIRINHAEMMLSTGGFTVTQVAERCGFQDLSYFSSLFKTVKGVPPSALFKT
ncbi:AraC family transcriptional regulator [Paenibacillus mucilaginosus]|uniref:Transcriptional regulator, AraC family n=1 Tax=Paenibacillus mucilaginosus (strain KNP414) TaxID=1036673 RepID=F8F603_PAEMK|nr:AraC family transcriptional regulator [Paenibacillus mucilaginosus]AEI41891.1 transcriptional regulator, AraC family [Paenibacillus mucilaginosus KNP414]MCG7214562.1 AraC family transcriptional regulator [Paenibacillus mucilaginosus]WDM30840.1 helix-turn-helix domain-containing protein [Paenibacillus mucilaginosus]